MSSGGGDEKGGAKGPQKNIAAAATVAVVTGLAWTVFKSFKAKKEEDALIEEYYGDRPPFLDPDGLGEREDSSLPTSADDSEETIKERSGFVKSEVEKPWFAFGKGKEPAGKPKHSKSKSYQIEKGDTLWGISGKFGVPLDALKAANDLSGDDIYADDTLIIPAK